MSRIPTRKIVLTNSKCVALLDGLNAISRGRQITVDGKNCDRGFVFSGTTGGDVRYTLARAAILLKPLIETFQKMNDDAFRDHTPVKGEDKDGKEILEIPVERRMDYNKVIADLFARSTEAVEFPVLCYEHLKVGDDKGQNPIPPNAIAALEPIMVWTQAEYDALTKDEKKPAEPTESEGGEG